MARFVLVCECDSDDFEHINDVDSFVCMNCGKVYNESEAGTNLLREEEE